jgi:hypothetical protein
MPNCEECGAIEIRGGIAHKATCSRRAKVASAPCSECGGRKTMAGYDHQPNCSKKVVARSHAILDEYAHFQAMAPLFPDPVKRFGFEWWANHFYQECGPVAKKEFYKWVYAPDRSLRRAYNSAGPSPEHAAWQELLEKMLKSGFDEYPDAYKGVDDTFFPSIKEDPLLKLGFRGELRQPHQVRQHNGCMPKAQIISLRRDMNMSALWHPFSRPELRNKVYYRKGNGDNCLYSAVSVAIDFDTASKFPLLSDLEKDNPDAFGTATVEAAGIASKVAAMRATLAADITRQHFDPNRRATDAKPQYNPGAMPAPSQKAVPFKEPARFQLRLLTSVRMNVYLFRIRGNTWNTESYQSYNRNAEFPERAMDKVPWGDFLARVRIDRIQFGKDSNDGHLGIVDGFDWLHQRRNLEQLLGGGQAGVTAVGRLQEFLQEIHHRGRLRGDGTGGIRFATANTDPNVQIGKVLKIEPRTDWGYVAR